MTKNKDSSFMKKRILYIEACDFVSYPLGGTLSFAKQFVENIKSDLLLVGFANEGEPLGEWFDKSIGLKKVKYFAFAYKREAIETKMPKRLFTYLELRKYIKILNKEHKSVVFSQTPQFVFLISKYKWEKFCFCFAGLGNSVGLSKYKILRIFGGIYEKKLFNDLKKSCDVILAAADNEAIYEVSKKYNLSENKIIPFPTRFDDKIFFSQKKAKIRQELGFSLKSKIIVTTGRLSYIKGWKLLIDSFRIFKSKHNDSILIFIGEGEDRLKIEDYCKKEIVNKEILLIGRRSHFEISKYLNVADLFIMSSLVEGWPTSMVEALACGKNIVSTDVSGAKEMIIDGKNGYVILKRDPDIFAEAFSMALNLTDPNMISLKHAERYTSSKLNWDFTKICLNESKN